MADDTEAVDSPWVLIEVRDPRGQVQVARYNTATGEAQPVEDDPEVRAILADVAEDLDQLPASGELDALAAGVLAAGGPTVRRVSVSNGATRGDSVRS